MGLAEDIIAKILQPIIDAVGRVFAISLRDVYHYIYPIVNDVARAVWTWMGPYVQPISDIANNLINFTSSFSARIYAIMQPFWSQITATLSGVASQIYAQIAGFLSHPLASIQQMLGSVSSWLQGIPAQIGGAVMGYFSQFQAWLGPTLQGIFASLQLLPAQFSSWFSSQNAALQAWLGNVNATLQLRLNDLSRIMSENLIPKIDAQGNKIEFLGMTMGIVSQDTKRWGDAIEKYSAPGEGNFFSALYETSIAIGGKIGSGIGVVMSELYEHVAGPLLNFIGGLIKKFAHSILVEVFGGEKTLTPTMMNTIESVMAVGGTIMTGLTTATVVGELAHPLKNLGLGRLANLGMEVVGWSEMVKNITDPLSKAKFGVPMMYEANYIFRPRIVNEMALKFQYFEGVITKEEFYREMGMHGYSDVQIDRVFREMFYEPSVREMCLIFDAYTPPETWTKNMLRARGLEEDSVEYVYQAIQFKAMKDEIGTIKSIVASLYADGIIEKDELMKFLEKIRFSGEWRDVYVSMLDAKIEASENKAEMDAWIETYKKGKANEAQTLDALVKLGMRPRIAAAKIQKITVGMKARGEIVEKHATLTKAEILSAYKAGIIHEDTARGRLAAFGYSIGDIDIYIALKAPTEEAA
jgi:hypothetical protein